jgi:hypothetical protein
VLAGCSAQSTATPDEAEADESNPELTIPITGLGEYEEKLREYGPMEGTVTSGLGGVETSPEDIITMIEEADSVVEERNWLAENTPVGEEPTYQVMNEYLTQKEPGEPSVQLNRKYVFLPGGEGIANMFTTVQDGQLQGEPSISYQVGVELLTDHPNQQGYEPLSNLRQTRGAGRIPQDYDGMISLMESIDRHGELTEEKVGAIREKTINAMSYAVLGKAEGDFMFYDGETSNFDASRVQEGNPEAAQAAAILPSELAGSEEYQADGWTSAEYTESGWEFRNHPDFNPRNGLPGER